MLRVIVFEEFNVLKLRFEGVLDATSIASFRKSITSGQAACGQRRLLADVGDLRLGDALGEAAILDALRIGVGYVAAKGRIAEILRGKDESDCKRECGAIKRLAFVLTRSCGSSLRPFCMKLYRLLHHQPF